MAASKMFHGSSYLTRLEEITQNLVRFTQNRASLEQHNGCVNLTHVKTTCSWIDFFFFFAKCMTHKGAPLSIHVRREVWENYATITTKSIFGMCVNNAFGVLFK